MGKYYFREELMRRTSNRSCIRNFLIRVSINAVMRQSKEPEQLPTPALDFLDGHRRSRLYRENKTSVKIFLVKYSNL